MLILHSATIEVNMAEPLVEDLIVDAVLTASRTLVAVATRSLGAAAEHTTIAQYRMLVVLASRGPQRIVGLAAGPPVTGPPPPGPGAAGVRGVAPHPGPARQVVDEATARRRVLIEDIL